MTNKIKDAIYTKRYVYNLHYHLIGVPNTAIKPLQLMN